MRIRMEMNAVVMKISKRNAEFCIKFVFFFCFFIFNERFDEFGLLIEALTTQFVIVSNQLLHVRAFITNHYF